MSLPTTLYHVVVSKGDGPRLRYAERGGGTFRQESEAVARAERHRRLGRKATVYVTPCGWRETEL